jgi:flagellar motility protein MotE (MotC chaperone)
MIVLAGLLFSLKLGGLWQGTEGLSAGVTPARAQDKDEKTEKAKADADAKDEDDGDKTAEDSDDDEKESDSAAEDDDEGEPQRFSKAEIEMLQSLVGRREALNKRERELDLRQNLLVVTERRVEQKIGQLKSIEAKIQSLLKEYDKGKEAKIRRLVKMYETMKPKKAAAIFEDMEKEILLDVAERMREVKMALVLAAMKPASARALTRELANRRSLPETGG